MTNAALTPVKIGGVTIKNRIFRPPHQLHMCAGGRVSDRFIAYHEERAAGGTGLITLEAAPVHWKSGPPPGVLTIWDDEAIEGISRVAERLKRYGTRVFIQLLNAGCNGGPWDGSPPWAPSSVTGYMPSGPAIEMTKWMIDEVIEAYVLGAKRALAAGLDGVEVHAAHGYLPRQFLCLATNWRTDEYGGSLENRARFLMDSMRALRAGLPKEKFAVGVRCSPDIDEGLSDMAETEQVMKWLEAERTVDYFSLSLGDAGRSELCASSMANPAGYELPYFRNVQTRLSTPVLVTGRFRTLDEAAQVIRDGQASMVGMVRAQIADPDLVRKTIEGRVDEVRPCIACNQRCIGGIAIGDIGCAVNPAAGRELELGAHRLERVAKPKRVVVIGGGVAGMEAARVAAVRGHKVVLFEASKDLGGVVRFVSKRAPKMGAFGDITFWQESELRRLDVDVRTNSYIDSEDLADESADVTIIATGSRPRMNGFQRHRPGHVVKGVDLSHVMSSRDLLTMAREKIGATAVVHDDVGHYEAIAAAEYLIEAGATVTYVTRFTSFAPLMEPTARSNEAYERLTRTGRFKIRTRAMLDQIDQTSVILFDPTIDHEPQTIPADIVVLVGYNASETELATALTQRGKRPISIGDALSPRYIEHAIREGYSAALQL
jgi:2,4-dienoyl-CoA reductase-like NADH-dependent reductase (Old Yellow Enzyme family)/thioredoxin reductase